MKIYDDGPDRPGGAEPGRATVGIAEYEVTTDGTILTTSGLGSCVGVALFDPQSGVTGLVHVMLPSADENVENEAKYADTGIEALVREMERHGADRERLLAKIAGGSDMLDFSSIGENVGSQNVTAVKETLDRLDIPVDREDVGGDHGRSLEITPDSGDLTVKTARSESQTL